MVCVTEMTLVITLFLAEKGLINICLHLEVDLKVRFLTTNLQFSERLQILAMSLFVGVLVKRVSKIKVTIVETSQCHCNILLQKGDSVHLMVIF